MIPDQRRIIQLQGAPFPCAEIQYVAANDGLVVFRWLSADGLPVDSGGSVARFQASEMEPSDTVLAMAIANPPPDEAPVPEEVPAWRIKAVAKLAGLDVAIAAALSALPEPSRTVATAAWTEGNVIRRDSATVGGLSAALGLSAAQVDQLFRQAAALEV